MKVVLFYIEYMVVFLLPLHFKVEVFALIYLVE